MKDKIEYCKIKIIQFFTFSVFGFISQQNDRR